MDRGLFVYLGLSEATDREVEELLESVDSLNFLGLSGTPVSGVLVERLAGRWQLERLNLHDTRVSKAEIRRIAEMHPRTRVLPKPKAES